LQNRTIVRFIARTMPRAPSSVAPGSPEPPAGRPVPKGRQTKAAIVDAALNLASQMGLEGLSIGALAELTQMSKSGVFAHFGSREELQISVIRAYHQRFEEEVFFPALQAARGLPRLRALFANWMQRVAVEIQSGCIFISGAAEFDDRPGPVRDALVGSVKSWLAALDKAVTQAKQEGDLRADADARQMAFEIHGLILALHYEERFLHNPGSLHRAEAGFEHVLERYGNPDAVASTVPSDVRPRARVSTPSRPSRSKE
jgi:AcrR family transcriptional regulator